MRRFILLAFLLTLVAVAPAAAKRPDHSRPSTQITAGPDDPTDSTDASFSFTGSDNRAVSGFDCRLDAGPWLACTSPTSYSALTLGLHTFYVRARDAAGNVDASPASESWTVTLALPSDLDGDGVPDSDDQCLSDPGPPSNGGCPVSGGDEPAPIAGQGYHQVFRDDFNGVALSADWWPHTFWNGDMIPGTVAVHDGMVSLYNRRSDGFPDSVDIATGPEWFEGPSGVPLHSFEFGYFEVRMRYTDARGAWPAFWLASLAHATANWPSCPEPDLNYELDVIEGQGIEPFFFHGTQHRNTGDQCGTPDQANGTVYDQVMPTRVAGSWHKFAARWTATDITWYYDDQPVGRAPLYDSGDQQMYLILSMYACGWDPNTCDSSTPAVLTTDADYVVAWQK